MLDNLQRRDFLKSTALLPLCALAVQAKPVYKTSLNAYSFNKMLNDSIKGRGAGITLVQVMEFAAKHKFEGFDATGYFFPGYPAVGTDSDGGERLIDHELPGTRLHLGGHGHQVEGRRHLGHRKN